jgi:PTS system nitrogen regulatory IIA component
MNDVRRDDAAPIGELIKRDDVLLDVEAATRDELLARAAAFLATRHGLPQRAIFDGLMAREHLGSTALGHGVALPHARMTTLQHAVAAFLRTRAPIDFEAPDHRPVSVFLILLVPAEASDRHLALMGCAASQFGDRGFRVQLKSAQEPDQIADLLRRLPAPHPDSR